MTTETASTMQIPATLAKLAVPIDSLNPLPRNVKQGDVGAIAVSLERTGQYRPIVVNKRDMTILAGNHTWLAARSLGWEKIAVTYVDVPDDVARRIALADNRYPELGSTDEELLADILREIAEAEGPDGLLGTGYDGEDLDDMLKKFVDEPPSDNPPALGAVEYRLVVECDSEQHQAELLERFEAEGLRVQAIAQ